MFRYVVIFILLGKFCRTNIFRDFGWQFWIPVDNNVILLHLLHHDCCWWIWTCFHQKSDTKWDKARLPENWRQYITSFGTWLSIKIKYFHSAKTSFSNNFFKNLGRFGKTNNFTEKVKFFHFEIINIQS